MVKDDHQQMQKMQFDCYDETQWMQFDVLKERETK